MSRGPEILSLAAKRGVHLRLDGERIVWRAQEGLDPTIERAVREYRPDVVEELRRRAEEERELVAACEARERLLQEVARIRSANGTAYSSDV